MFLTAFVVTYVVTIGLTAGRIHRHYELWQSGQTTTGQAYDVTWHGKYTDCDFRFSLDGVEQQDYSATCDNLTDGQQVTVHYLPTDLGSASLRSGPHELAWDICGPLVLALGVGELCAIWALRVWRRRRK